MPIAPSGHPQPEYRAEADWSQADPTGGWAIEDEPPRSPRRGLLIGGSVALVALLAGGMFFVLGGDDDSSGSSTGEFPAAVMREPAEFASIDVDGSAYPAGVIGDTLIAMVYEDGSEEVRAYDLETGDELWKEDASSALAIGNTVFAVSGDELLFLDSAGEEATPSADLDGEGGYMSRLSSGLLRVSTGDGTPYGIVDIASRTVVFDEFSFVSANGRYVVELDFNDNDVEVTVSSLPGGDEVAQFDVDGQPTGVLDDGRVVAIDDEDVVIWSLEGEELVKEDVGDFVYDSRAVGDFLAVESEGGSLLFRVDGDTLVELDDLDGAFLRRGPGGPLIMDEDDDLKISRIVGDSVESVIDVNDGRWRAIADRVVYVVVDGDTLEAWPIAGGDEPLWSLDIDDDTGVEFFDGSFATSEVSNDGDETTITLYR